MSSGGFRVKDNSKNCLKTVYVPDELLTNLSSTKKRMSSRVKKLHCKESACASFV